MLDVALAFLWPDGMMNHTAQAAEVVRAPAADTFQLYPTANGAIGLVVLTDAQWDGLAVVVLLDIVAKEPQGVANEALEVFEHPVLGPIHQPNPVPRFADVEPRNLRPAPRLGEHTREILGEIGVSSSDLRAMELAGAALHADAMDEAVL
jgi:crotonobetainyl-CoA:carnitine CoA-transferase CaiB-like acyl-CoA transferase